MVNFSLITPTIVFKRLSFLKLVYQFGLPKINVFIRLTSFYEKIYFINISSMTGLSNSIKTNYEK